MWLDRWESLMLRHQPTKLSDYRDCGSGDIMFLVVEEQ